MKRYVTRPAGWYDEWSNEPGTPPFSTTVWERDCSPRRTGLVDAAGNDLYAINEMSPIGFIHGEVIK